MIISIDSREKNSLVISELISQKADIEVKQLEIADYIIGDIAIERKTVNDFISSMINRRLIQQLPNLQQFENRLIIIEGLDENELYDDDKESGVHPNAIRGMILSIIFDYKTPIILTKDYKDTAKFLILTAKRFEKEKQELSLNAKRKAKNIYEQQRFIIEGFPGIGPKTARELLKKFKTLKGVINAPLEEIARIKKMNEKKARKFIDLINTKYRN